MFNVNATGSTEDKIEAQKKKYEEYITALAEYEALYEIEVENIHKGFYRAPFTTELGHREINPVWARSKANEFFSNSKVTSISKDGK